MGERDLVPAACSPRASTRHFHRWAVKPGGPLWFGVARRHPRLRASGQPGRHVRRVRGPRRARAAHAARGVRSRRARDGPRAGPTGACPRPIARLQFVPGDAARRRRGRTRACAPCASRARETSSPSPTPTRWRSSGPPAGDAAARRSPRGGRSGPRAPRSSPPFPSMALVGGSPRRRLRGRRVRSAIVSDRVRTAVERLLLIVLGVALETLAQPPGVAPALVFAAGRAVPAAAVRIAAGCAGSGGRCSTAS